MEEFKVIEFHAVRDFGRKINATFEFIKQNFKPLVVSILVIAGPPVIVGIFMMVTFFSDMMSMIPRAGSDPQDFVNQISSVSYWINLLVMYVALLLSFVISIATIHGYVLTYYRKRTNKITLSEAWEGARALILKYIGSFFLQILSVGALVMIAVVVGIVIQQISNVLLGFYVFGCFIGFIYLMVGISLTFFIQANEGSSFFEAAMRSLYLIRGKWWSTFGLAAVLTMIAWMISYIFLIPYYIVSITSALHSVKSSDPTEMFDSMKLMMTIFFPLYYVAHLLLQSLPQIGLIFQYFNLVERKESKGLLQDIDNFGGASQDQSSSGQFPA